MKNIAMKNIARFLIACAFVGFMVGCSTRVNVSETYINESINEAPQTQIVQGALQSAPIPPLQSAPLQIINANDKSVIDANDFANTQYVSIIFDSEVLYGGIYDENTNLYKSPDRRISFEIKEKDTLEIREIYKQLSFTIKNFSDGDFNIYLSKNPTKEVAIVLNINQSMLLYIDALRDIAPFIAKHILGDREKQFAKITLVTFSHLDVDDLGTFYDSQDFLNITNRLKYNAKSMDNMVNLSLIRAMQNFTKFNGLAKEIYLITNGAPDDPQNDNTMLFFATSLAKSPKDMSPVKIHIFLPLPFQSRQSEQENIRLLTKIAESTGGSFNMTNSIEEFKDKVLTTSNDGKPVDRHEIDNQIRIIEGIKVFDPESK